MLRGNCDGVGNLRGSGGDAAVVWAEYWVFVLQEVEAGEGEQFKINMGAMEAGEPQAVRMGNLLDEMGSCEYSCTSLRYSRATLRCLRSRV